MDIALLPECCNRGIGTTLLHGLQAEAAAAGKPRLRSSRFRLPPSPSYGGQDGGQAAAHLRRRASVPRCGSTSGSGRQIDDRGVYLFMEWRGRRRRQGTRDKGQGKRDKAKAPSSTMTELVI